MSGIHVLRGLREATPWVACLVVTGHGSLADSIEAMRAGACDWVRKPVSEPELLAAIDRALVGRPKGEYAYLQLPASEPHAHLRLAFKAVQFMGSPRDAPTLREFGRALGISVGGFRNWCRTAGVRPRAYLHFARALRVVYRREQNPSESVENLLHVIDKRTLEKFVVAAGGTRQGLPATVGQLLTAQRLISPEALVAFASH